LRQLSFQDPILTASRSSGHKSASESPPRNSLHILAGMLVNVAGVPNPEQGLFVQAIASDHFSALFGDNAEKRRVRKHGREDSNGDIRSRKIRGKIVVAASAPKASKQMRPHTSASAVEARRMTIDEFSVTRAAGGTMRAVSPLENVVPC
jgi:hypothetical protein